MADRATSPIHDRELSSWKEIASYLNVSVRTAQAWEERGLPVRRVPGGRARVTASVVALEFWRSSADTQDSEPPVPAAQTTRPFVRISRRGLIVLGSVVFFLIMASAGHALLGSARPFSARIEHHALVVLDARGRELWRKGFAWLDDPGATTDRVVWLGDLQGNGQTEVLFAPPLHADEGTYLMCYSQDGRELWRFTPGRPVTTAAETFAPRFRVGSFLVGRLGRDRALHIAVSSRHYRYYPDQVALLSTDGRALREYWHPGHLNDLLALDLAHNGTNQLILGGINNARRQATLVVLDPDHFGGAAIEENPSYQFQGFAPGVETARLLFPRSCMNNRFDSYNSVEEVGHDSSGLVVAVNEASHPLDPQVDFHLDAGLRLVHLDISDRYREEHAGLQAHGELDHAFSVREQTALGAITYLGPDGRPLAAR